MAWTETKPAAGDPLNELVSILTSQAILFRQGIEKHSFWTDSSGLSAGIPRQSGASAGPGAARAFYDVESNLSSALSASKPLAGRLFVSSDGSRLWGYSSGDTIPLGGTKAIVWKTTAVTDSRVLVQMGSLSLSGSVVTTAFATAYSRQPFVQFGYLPASSDSECLASVVSSSTTMFAAVARNVWGAGNTAQTVMWRSHGTVAL